MGINFKGVILITTLAFALCTTPAILAQRRQQPRPTRAATPTPAPASAESTRNEPEERAAAKRIVTVTLKEGAPVTGDYLNASATTLFLMVAGNRLSIKLDDVTAIHFGEAPPATATSAPQTPLPQMGTLSLEAGIIYKMGGNQPVSRTEFVLLDQSLEMILTEAGIPPGRTGILSNYAFAVQYPSQFPGVAEKARAAIEQHTIQKVSTDFSGKAQFTDIKPGNYYIMGLSSTRRGFAIWNLPVEVKAGQNSILLDQNNAATAF